MERLPLGGYYAILDLDEAGPRGPDGAETRAQAMLAARPCCLQLRAKRFAPARLRDTAARVAALCRSAGIPFCVNDRVDVALLVDADVVHVGQDDLPLAEARALIGRARRRTRFVGVSTHDLAQARAAARGGADYVAFGPIFATGNKERPDPVVGLPGLAEVAAALEVPVVAIGGIDLGNVALVARAGASAAAVIGAVDRAADPRVAGEAVGAAFASRGPE